MPVMSSYGFSSSERETMLPINAWSLDHEEFNGRKTTTTVIILHVFVFKSWLGSNFNRQEITKLMFWALALCRLVLNRIRSWRFERVSPSSSLSHKVTKMTFWAFALTKGRLSAENISVVMSSQWKFSLSLHHPRGTSVSLETNLSFVFVPFCVYCPEGSVEKVWLGN